MSKRINMWLPDGSNKVEIFENDKARFLSNGWIDTDPALQKTITEEVVEDGDVYRKRRNRKSRISGSGGDPFLLDRRDDGHS